MDDPPNKVPKLQNPLNDPDGSSPRKDFSIAGLLHSQPDQHLLQPSTSYARPPSVVPMVSTMSATPRPSNIPNIPTMGGLGLTPRPQTGGQLVSFPAGVATSGQRPGVHVITFLSSSLK